MELRQVSRLSSLDALFDAYGDDPSVNHEIGARCAAACRTGCVSSLGTAWYERAMGKRDVEPLFLVSSCYSTCF